MGCTALETAENTGKLKFINEGAFSGCSALKSMEISPVTESIGERAFEGCTSLTLIASEGSLAWNYAKDNGIRVQQPSGN